MGRIRTIKPEFPQSESMGRVSREARLLFILLWTLVDDSGRTRAASRMLASLLYPYDDDARDLVEDWLDELDQEGCLVRYEHEGQTYLQIVNFLQHQKIDKPTPSKLPEFREESRILARPRRALAKNCLGREGKGEDQGEEFTSETSSLVPVEPKKAPAKKSDLPPHLLAVFHATREAFEQNPRAKGIMYQDRATTAREMKALKTLVERASNLCPDAPSAFLAQAMDRYKGMVNGKLQGKASWTPSGLATDWVWRLVLEGMEAEPSHEDQATVQAFAGILTKKAGQ